jgi:hypothetical protein
VAFKIEPIKSIIRVLWVSSVSVGFDELYKSTGE